MRSLLLVALATSLLGPALARGQSTELRALADSLGVPGAAWSIVRSGEVTELGASGSLDGSRPVDPETSVFRVASVSKVITASVAARMAAAGEVDLDSDLRRTIGWLAMREPITLRQLLTHTSGLDDRLTGMLARSPDDVQDLGDHLRRNLPPRTTPPGRYIRYSNYGVALAGYALAEAAGVPFDRLVQREIFDPFGMRSSTFSQPIPDLMLQRLVRAYSCPDQDCEPRPIDYRQTPPAGALVTSAADMGRFLESVVTGRLGAEATRILTTRQFTHRPELPGIALALQEQMMAGRRALVHTGTSSGYRALLVVLPADSTGFFLVASGGASEFGRSALRLFEETLDVRAAPAGKIPRPATIQERTRYEGPYLLTRAPRGTLERFPGLFAFGTTVGFDDDGYLVRREGSVHRRYGLVATDLFRSLDGPERLAFRTEGSSARTMFAADEFFGIRFPASWERLPAWRSPHFTNELMSWILGLPAILLVLWVLMALARLFSRRWPSGLRRSMSAMSGIGAALTITAMGMYGFGFLAPFNRMAMESPEELGYGMPEALSGLVPLAWAIPVLAVLSLVLAARKCAMPDRVLLLMTGLAAASFSALLFHFNLLPPAL